MTSPQQRMAQLQQGVVTAAQMTAIETRLFDAGMPVAALMEKVAGRIAQRIQALYPPCRVGVLAGPGHNGGDALVVARELQAQGYGVKVYQPFSRLKELTATHARYVAHLGIPFVPGVEDLQPCDLLVDGVFGFGLTRPLEGEMAAAIATLNQSTCPVVSIDVPSGLHTDTGEVLGTAVRATHTLCLGLWKRAFVQDQGLDWIGQAELLDFDIPLADVRAVLGDAPVVQRITREMAMAALPLPRPAATYKYQQGHLLLVCGSRAYGGAAVLAAAAARASGVGMLSIAVPESLQPILTAQIPDALVIGCPETASGAIAHLPPPVDLNRYQAIACGPGLTPAAETAIRQVVDSDILLLLDADGLNGVAAWGTAETLNARRATTVLTPHAGEFKRLFPELADQLGDRIAAVLAAAQTCGAIVVLKGARVAIATPQGQVWINPNSTPALARGGSGDVLTGLMGGLLAQAARQGRSIEAAVQVATWWHAQAGCLAAQRCTELGVDASTLVQWLIPALQPG